jgi:hypothetical protein
MYCIVTFTLSIIHSDHSLPIMFTLSNILKFRSSVLSGTFTGWCHIYLFFLSSPFHAIQRIYVYSSQLLNCENAKMHSPRYRYMQEFSYTLLYTLYYEVFFICKTFQNLEFLLLYYQRENSGRKTGEQKCQSCFCAVM